MMTSYQFASFSFDTVTGRLTSHASSTETEIHLRHKVSQILTFLLAHPDQLISKDTLLDALWDHSEYRENSLTQSIRELRKALGDSAQNPKFIRTYPQRGYQWICPLNPPETETHTEAEPKPETEQTSPLKHGERERRTSQSWFVHWPAIVISLLLVTVLTAGGFTWHLMSAATSEPHAARSSHPQNGLVILPLINDTGDAQYDWIQLGLADMLAAQLSKNQQLTVIPPAIANAWLLDAGLSWPTLPAQIRTLLSQRGFQAALFGAVRQHNHQQILEFQLIYADGRTQQGSMAYPQLTPAIASVSHQLQRLFRPDHTSLQPEQSPGIAAQSLAQGRSLLQTQGAQAARKFFDAARILEPDNLWARIQLAGTDVRLGKWQEAQQQLNALPEARLQEESALYAAQRYWLSEISYRRGEPDAAIQIEQAVAAAEQANDLATLVRVYQLQTQLAWNLMDWETHHQLTQNLTTLLGKGQALRQDADQLFYLGRPANVGLEKIPGNDLAANQVRLFKALNFYRQLGDQPRQAATLLAIAQNDQTDLSIRQSSLSEAISMYRELGQPYELAQALIYQGFYLMQSHQGQSAEVYFSEARALAEQLGAQRLLLDSEFYLAFAAMDQGLDLQWLGKHPQQPHQLARARKAFSQLLKKDISPLLETNIALFQSWIAADQNKMQLAMQHLDHATSLANTLDLPLTQGYIRYSKMRIHLSRHNYTAVTELATIPIVTRLEAVYTARAYYELGQPGEAARILALFRETLPEQWQPEDEQRLKDYQGASQGEVITLSPEPKAHLVYCESDWL
ncbi:winged helix-turn-helix domain-containing protein [Photobacterium sp. 53610]|uniref:winged helix-turn-helix domain-containing protein n=1 Tax=Photobacterium sp. 53610 TaxID=3102789 RepID=UPI002ED965BA